MNGLARLFLSSPSSSPAQSPQTDNRDRTSSNRFLIPESTETPDYILHDPPKAQPLFFGNTTIPAIGEPELRMLEESSVSSASVEGTKPHSPGRAAQVFVQQELGKLAPVLDFDELIEYQPNHTMDSEEDGHSLISAGDSGRASTFFTSLLSLHLIFDT